ncbi:hypothetical protein [Egicoccus sp. AB-alg2]|uniref:hypothetical protein n=1 Tax=Egicoccus sp. AB-alg2 TaxID=3242693 RepID=UPI00359E005A
MTPAVSGVVVDDETAAAVPGTRTFDVSVHGVVTLRFVDAPWRFADRFTTRWQRYLLPAAGADPDLVVRFADVAPPSPSFVGQRWCAVDESGLFVLDEVDGRALARLPLDEFGSTAEIRCRRDVTAVPFLVEAICLAFLARGYVPLHGSAVVHEGRGVVFMGWPKGGKTGALLGFVGHGARFVGDEWVLLSPDGSAVLGLPLSLSVSAWQLPYLGIAPATLPGGKRRLFRAVAGLEWVARATARGRLARSEPVTLLHKALPTLRRQLRVSRPPAAWFPDRIGPVTAPVDVLFLVEGHAAPDVRVEREPPARLARRMVHANAYEWRPLLDRYRAFRFAHPDRRNALLDDLEARLGPPMAAAMAGTPAYRVRHPYGGSLDVLYAAIAPYVSGSSADGVGRVSG